jgi:hypothetical protein
MDSNEFSRLVDADVKTPCDEFEQRCRIVHFISSESQNLSFTF